jgi:hypothetical protein
MPSNKQLLNSISYYRVFESVCKFPHVNTTYVSPKRLKLLTRS